MLRPKRVGAGRVAEADPERSRASCWLKEVEAERGAAEAVVEKRPIERVDVAEDSWKEVEGEQDRTPGGDVGSRQASRSIVGSVSVQSEVTNVTTWETKGGGKVRFISREEWSCHQEKDRSVVVVGTATVNLKVGESACMNKDVLYVYFRRSCTVRSR